MILTTAFLTSLLLTFLLATAVIARSGLRGGLGLLAIGFAAGLIISPLEIALDLLHHPFVEAIASLPLQFLAIGITKAMVYGFAVSAAITLASGFVEKAKRRGDIWNVAVGLGCGLGVSSTLIALWDSQSGWPPFVLVTALANTPFQLCFAMVVSGALLRSRFPGQTSGWHPLLIYGTAIVLGAAYQSVLQATLSIGHWLAWIEPTMMGMLWLTLIAIFWLTGLAVMASQSLTAMPQDHHPSNQPGKTRLLLRPGLWKLLALLVIAPAFALFAATWWWNIDTPLGRVLIYTLLATPLLAGSIVLRTALALELKPLEFRLK